MLEEVLRYCRNWFDTRRHFGKFAIEGSTLVLPSLQNGQYFRIVGSVFNDGVYEYPANNLKDEVFEGAVWELAIPKNVEILSFEICEWMEKNKTAVESVYQSESFGGYSYTKRGEATWQNVFGSRLNQWRKI